MNLKLIAPILPPSLVPSMGIFFLLILITWVLCDLPLNIFPTWIQARVQIRNPNPRTNHQSQAFSDLTRSVDLLTMRVHFAKDKPKPAKAPYLDNKLDGSNLSIYLQLST